MAGSVQGRGYRALHYVLKIGDRKSAIHFFKDILGMRVLRHEEFEKGCEATCNGPYDGKWSKTMIGYGPEDTNFVLELTYNYGISSYRHGNALDSIEIQKTDLSTITALGENPNSDGSYLLKNNGYKFVVQKSSKGDSITRVNISSGFEEGSKGAHAIFYERVLGMKQVDALIKSFKSFSYGHDQTMLSLRTLYDGSVDHGTAFGRMAFACPTSDLPMIQKNVQEGTDLNGFKGKILTPLISLDTPGKATVSVVIVADLSDHEICFVGDEAFRELSKVDPNADAILSKKISEDKSDEWFAKHGQTKKSST